MSISITCCGPAISPSSDRHLMFPYWHGILWTVWALAIAELLWTAWRRRELIRVTLARLRRA